MKSLAENLKEATPESRQAWYPIFNTTTKIFPELDEKKLGTKLILKIEAKISSVVKRDNNPKEFTIELRAAEIENEK